MAPSRIPDRWSIYKPIGTAIEGTRFFAFKVPLAEFQNKKIVDVDKRLDCQTVVDRVPNIGLVIDLTNTLRYYKPEEFLSKGIEHHKIFTEGHVVPSQRVINKFNDAVQKYLSKNFENDKLIGVHCTHGVNRTGFLLCQFMVKILSMKAEEALKRFGEARGHSIERKNYIDALYKLESSEKPECNNNMERNITKDKDFIYNSRITSQRINVQPYSRPYGDFNNRSRYNQRRRIDLNQSYYQQVYNPDYYNYRSPNSYHRPQDEVFYNDDVL